jgi:succinoglycan biosynthesis transport protein ExoP
MYSEEPRSDQTLRVPAGSSGQSGSSDAPFSFATQLHHLRKSWVLIVLCSLVGLCAGVVSALLPRHYTAISKIQVRPGSSSQYRIDKSDLLSLGDDSTKLETETMILESDTLLLDTAHKLHLDTNPEFMGRITQEDSISGPRADERLLTRLHQSIHTILVPRTEIMQVSCNTKSGPLSARIANTLVAEYIQRISESRFDSTQRVSKWLSTQLGDLKDQVENDEEKLIQIQSRLGIVGLDQSHDIVVTELEDLTKAADEARADRIIAEARYRILSSGDANLLEGGQEAVGRNSAGNSQMALLANLRNQKAQIEARYAGLKAQFGAKYPEVQRASAELATVNVEIQQEQTRVLNQAQQTYSAATSDEQKTFATLNDKKSVAFKKQNEMVQYQILLHDYESNRTLYEGLVQRLRQAGIVAGLESSEVDIIDLARIPGKPSEIGRTFTALMGLIFGLALGVVAALLAAHFDQRLHDLSAIESQMGLALLSVTTKIDKNFEAISKSQSGSLKSTMPETFLQMSNSPFVESMWSLRASLLLSNPGRPPRVMLFTSCNPGEGKSTIASAQACALALRNAKVVIIDGDMRRPTLMRNFALKNDVGLSSLLTGRATLDEAIKPVDSIPNLSVITSGPIPPSAALILSSDGLKKLLSSLTERYDYVIIDSPPLLGLADASTLAQFAEAIVVVLSYANLNRVQIERATKVLQSVGRSITGLALNFADPTSMGYYGYGHGYGDYYADAPPAKEPSR